MRKYNILTTILSIISVAIAADAIPARHGTFTYTQPDGTVITLRRMGDEFAHWTLDSSGRIVEMDSDGFYRPSGLTPQMRLAAGKERRVSAEAQRMSVRANSSASMGTHHIPVVLVNFSDLSFKTSSPQSKFDALLNEEGYSTGGATGSVRDFYVQNSHGLYTPVFDVYGPVTLENDMAYYGGNSQGSDKAPELALYHACQILDDEVDFSQYDSDGDGIVDMFLFYYAGYSEAEGGPANSIWPHQWSVQYSSNSSARNAKFDGVKLGNYFCTSELQGATGSKMCAIGPTCHEFGHSLGLPDFYDTDYSTNGIAGGMYEYSTMCDGPYNNDSRTPPYFNFIERSMLEWCDADAEEITSGSYTLGGVDSNLALISYTDTEGEYFIYECRDGSGWDAPIHSGLLVYHVDKSSRKVSLGTGGSTTAKNLWEKWSTYNYINGNGSHPCGYIIAAADQGNLMFGYQYYSSYGEYYYNSYLYGSQIPFPGSKKVTEYSPVDWDGNETLVYLSDISYSDGTVSFTAVSYRESEGGGEMALSSMGYASIEESSASYTAGKQYTFSLAAAEGDAPESVTWYLDGEAQSSSDITLKKKGEHIVSAELIYSDGRREIIDRQVSVN